MRLSIEGAANRMASNEDTDLGTALRSVRGEVEQNDFDRCAHGACRDLGEIESELEQLASDFVKTYMEKILSTLASFLESVFIKGVFDAYDHWNGKLGTRLTPPNQLMLQARQFASSLSKKLGRSIHSYVLKIIREMAKRLLNNGQSTDSVVEEIRKTVFTDKIAENVATEVAKDNETEAFEAGTYHANRHLGATGKRWVTVGDNRVDEVCLRNEAVGEIPVTDLFPSRHLHIPAHPGCRCHIIYEGVSRKSLFWSNRL